MALEDKTPLSITDLNENSLFKIFSYLKLSEIANFRCQCSILNKIVLKYLFPITKISILYTENEDPEPKLSPSSKRRRVGNPSLSRNPPILTIRGLLDQTLEDCVPKPHFPAGEFIVISGIQKYAMFSRFVEKYIPNITKLALIIDPKPNEFPVLLACALLKAYPKVETLFLERTNRDPRTVFRIDNRGGFMMAIAGLSKLSELHFFSRRTSEICLNASNALAQTMIGNFLLRMVNKLQIFRMNHFSYERDFDYDEPFEYDQSYYLDPLLGKPFDDILELGFETDDCMQLTNSGTVFEKLHTLTLFGHSDSTDHPFNRFDAYSIGNSFQLLTTLQFSEILKLNNEVMLNLNALPSLEKLNVKRLKLTNGLTYERVKINDDYEYVNVNKSIKHIQVETVDMWRLTSYAFTDFFQSLLTVTVLKPEVKVYERFNRDFYDIQITNY